VNLKKFKNKTKTRCARNCCCWYLGDSNRGRTSYDPVRLGLQYSFGVCDQVYAVRVFWFSYSQKCRFSRPRKNLNLKTLEAAERGRSRWNSTAAPRAYPSVFRPSWRLFSPETCRAVDILLMELWFKGNEGRPARCPYPGCTESKLWNCAKEGLYSTLSLRSRDPPVQLRGMRSLLSR